MTMKFRKTKDVNILILLKYLLSILILLSYLSPVWADTGRTIKPEPEHSSQCIKIIRALERYHYLEKNLDNSMSSIILEQYLNRLDPGKQLFTIKDVDQLKQYKFQFDNDLKKGRLNTAFKIFNLYMARSKERM